jgi:HK97 family phage major capsid protein
MANETLELYQKRAKALEDARSFHEKAVNEKREMTQEEQNSYDAAMNEFRDLHKQIQESDRLETIQKAKDALNEKRERFDFRTIPNYPEIRGVNKEKETELRGKFSGYLGHGQGSVAEQEYRALQQDNATQAGYLVAPQSFMAEIIQDLYKDTFFRQLARVLPPLVKADSLGVPTKTANMSNFAWGSELGAPNADSTLAFGKREFRPHPATGEILVSKTLIRNAAISPDMIVREEIANEVAENLEQAYMTGTGVNQPLGVFVASNDGITTGQDVSTGNTATTITFDNLIECKYKIVKTKYWPRLNWIFHPDAVKMLAKIKNGDGDYIWRTSITMSEPDRLLNFPVRMSEFAPNTFTTGKYVGLLGDFNSGYWIVDSLGMEIQVLYELYARSNQVDYIYRIETDGAPVKNECFARVTLA